MRPSVVVYTCVIGTRDKLQEQSAAQADFQAFVERPSASATWKQSPAPALFASARRNARAPKVLSHLFVSADISLWIDAKVVLHQPADILAPRWLGDNDMAVFAHPRRDCLYEEAAVCAQRGLDDPAALAEQADYYRRRGFPVHQGLAETMVIVRRHNSVVRDFNCHWWSHLCRYSVRDQVSFMYCAAEAGVRLGFIPGDVRRAPALQFHRRPAEPEST